MKKKFIKRGLVTTLLLVGCLMLISYQNNNIQTFLESKMNLKSQNVLTEETKNTLNQDLGQGVTISNEKNKVLTTTKEELKKEEVKNAVDNEIKQQVSVKVGQATVNTVIEKKTNPVIIPSNKVDVDKAEIKDSNNKIIGIINDIFIKDNKTYITVDEVEFFRNESAYNEARKDGKLYKDENGKEFLPDGYYIRNNSSELKTYEVSNSPKFNLCIYIVDPKSTANSSQTVAVNYDYFNKYINDSKKYDGRSRMFWINSENNLVNKIEMQFTP